MWVVVLPSVAEKNFPTCECRVVGQNSSLVENAREVPSASDDITFAF